MLMKIAEEFAYTLICMAGNRKSFAKMEKAVKDAALIGFKNAVGRWENEHPRKYDAEGKEIRE